MLEIFLFLTPGCCILGFIIEIAKANLYFINCWGKACIKDLIVYFMTYIQIGRGHSVLRLKTRKTLFGPVNISIFI